MSATIRHIYRYPVKGLTAEALDAADLAAGDYLPGDRRFALALATTPTSGTRMEWMPKRNFLALVKDARLATLETEFDHAAETLTIKRQGRQVARGKLTDRIGRAMIEDFFAAYMKEESRGRPRLVECVPGGRLTDQSTALVSIINLASIRDLEERVMKTAIDPLRFRANIYIDGIAPWAEFDWLGKAVSLGGATVEVTERIDRCAAVNVNPRTAERDLNIVKALQAGYGHIDMGVFARVTRGGRIVLGDSAGPA